jgi:hypothetical protein
MPDQPENTKRPTPDDYEQRGLITDVVVPPAQPVVGGAAAAYFADKLNPAQGPARRQVERHVSLQDQKHVLEALYVLTEASCGISTPLPKSVWYRYTSSATTSS